jgi:hypothetical protein
MAVKFACFSADSSAQTFPFHKICEEIATLCKINFPKKGTI